MGQSLFCANMGILWQHFLKQILSKCVMFLINSSDGFSISKLPLSYIVYGAPLYTIQALG